jgi:hypothetical protein
MRTGTLMVTKELPQKLYRLVEDPDAGDILIQSGQILVA